MEKKNERKREWMNERKGVRKRTNKTIWVFDWKKNGKVDPRGKYILVFVFIAMVQLNYSIEKKKYNEKNLFVRYCVDLKLSICRGSALLFIRCHSNAVLGYPSFLISLIHFFDKFRVTVFLRVALTLWALITSKTTACFNINRKCGIVVTKVRK